MFFMINYKVTIYYKIIKKMFYCKNTYIVLMNTDIVFTLNYMVIHTFLLLKPYIVKLWFVPLYIFFTIYFYI